jgi:hypothetical protein
MTKTRAAGKIWLSSCSPLGYLSGVNVRFLFALGLCACTTFGSGTPAEDAGLVADATQTKDAATSEDAAIPPGSSFCRERKDALACADYDDGEFRQIFIAGREQTAEATSGDPEVTLVVRAGELVASSRKSTSTAFVFVPNAAAAFRFSVEVRSLESTGDVEIVRLERSSHSAAHVWVRGAQVVFEADGGRTAFDKPPGPFAIVLTSSSFGVATASGIPATIDLQSMLSDVSELRVGAGQPVSGLATVRLDNVLLTRL